MNNTYEYTYSLAYSYEIGKMIIFHVPYLCAGINWWVVEVNFMLQVKLMFLCVFMCGALTPSFDRSSFNIIFVNDSRSNASTCTRNILAQFYSISVEENNLFIFSYWACMWQMCVKPSNSIISYFWAFICLTQWGSIAYVLDAFFSLLKFGIVTVVVVSLRNLTRAGKILRQIYRYRWCQCLRECVWESENNAIVHTH